MVAFEYHTVTRFGGIEMANSGHLGVRSEYDGAAFALLGAHGGAGVSTVAAFLDPSRSSGTVLELRHGEQLPHHYRPLVVAQSTAFGMRAAAELVAHWHPGLVRPWLVIVRDAPLPVPACVRYRRRAIANRVAGMTEVPYLPQLRAVDVPAEALRHRPVQRAASRLRAALGLPH